MPTDDYIKRIDALFELYRYASEKDLTIVIAYREDFRERIEKIPAADVEPKRKWVSVKERLPEEKISPMTMDFTEYPCVFDGRAGQREVRYYKFGKGHFWHGSGCIDEYVTHWAEPMPLPEPPKGENDVG